MLPYPAVLIGVDDKWLPAVREELANLSARVDAEYSSAGAAMTGLYGASDSRRLLIVQIGSTDDPAWVRRLAESYRTWPILALVETAAGASGLLEANRAGAAQVVPVPLRDGDLYAALNGIGLQFRSAGDDCQLIAFTGSAAGCGATMLATNAAYEISLRHERHTVLMEMTQAMGVVATNLDLEPACTLADLLSDIDHVDAQLVRQSLVHVGARFGVLAARRAVGQGGSLDLQGALRVMDYIVSMSEILVLDVPCTYDYYQFELLSRAHDVVLVGEQSITSVRTLKLILDTLKAGPGNRNYHVIINRYNATTKGLDVASLERAMQLCGIRTVPDDRAGVLSAVNEGRLLRQADPRSAVLAAIDSLVDNLPGAKRPTPELSTSLFGRVLSAFKK